MFYMFFWFFKQLYYCLRRIFKSGILLLILFFIAFLFIFVKPSFAFSNTDYTEIDYIESSGTQYIDTGISPYHTMTEGKFQLTTLFNYAHENGYVAGVWNDNNNRYYCPQYHPENNEFVCSTKNNTVVVLGDADLNTHTFTYNNSSNQVIFDNQVISSSITDLSTQTNRHIYLFALNSSHGASQFLFGRIYYLRITNKTNNQLLRDFVPVIRNSDGVVGLYDNVSNTFFTNSGSGSFTAGPSAEPFITNSSSSISDFSFTTLNINASSLSYDDTYFLGFTYNDTYYIDDIDVYKSLNNGLLYFNIPKNFITNNIVVRDGSTLSFNLVQRHNLQTFNYDLSSYTLDLTTEQQEVINQDSDKQLLNDLNNEQKNTTNAINNLNNSQQETTNAINDLNNTITDNSVDNSSVYLPQDNSNDITASGLNGIFSSIYNAFCTGTAQDIVFPIPFTSKSITLQANYVRSMLTNSNATWVITIIEAFWWYLISRFIIKDITSKITKIKSGNIEDIEKSNIKGDML